MGTSSAHTDPTSASGEGPSHGASRPPLRRSSLFEYVMCSIIDATSTWPGWCFNLWVKWSVKSGFPHLTLAKTAGSTSDRTAWKLASKSTTEAYAELTRVPFTRARPSLGVQLEEPAPQLKGCGSIHGLAVRPINGAAMYYSRTRSSEAVIVPLSGTSQVD